MSLVIPAEDLEALVLLLAAPAAAEGVEQVQLAPATPAVVSVAALVAALAVVPVGLARLALGVVLREVLQTQPAPELAVVVEL